MHSFYTAYYKRFGYRDFKVYKVRNLKTYALSGRLPKNLIQPSLSKLIILTIQNTEKNCLLIVNSTWDFKE